MDATIVIPVKNGGELLREVLSAVFSQKTEYSYEVICIDSGSSDNSVDIIKSFPAALYEIAPNEFGHGKTRNFGASKGSGEYIIFITQDAKPASDMWLQNFLDAMNEDKEIVGGFGIHLPYPDCNVFDKLDLKVHFERFGSDNTVFQLTDRERYDRDEPYRHLLSFFSDNNSCLRRSVWEKYPYEDVPFAEDQIWARKMIELGYKKLYCARAPVYHSHDYPIGTYFKRYYDEFKSQWNLHNFLILKHWFYIPPAIIRHVWNDVRYVRSLPLTYGEKFHWCWYSLRRNYARYTAGYIGGRYHSFPRWLRKFTDRRFSQQYDQINNKERSK